MKDKIKNEQSATVDDKLKEAAERLYNNIALTPVSSSKYGLNQLIADIVLVTQSITSPTPEPTADIAEERREAYEAISFWIGCNPPRTPSNSDVLDNIETIKRLLLTPEPEVVSKVEIFDRMRKRKASDVKLTEIGAFLIEFPNGVKIVEN